MREERAAQNVAISRCTRNTHRQLSALPLKLLAQVTQGMMQLRPQRLGLRVLPLRVHEKQEQESNGKGELQDPGQHRPVRA